MKASSASTIFGPYLTNPPSRLGEFFRNLRACVRCPPRIVVTSKALNVPYADLGRGALPGRGILYSSILHEIILVLIFVVPAVLPSSVPERKREYERQWLDTKLTYSLPALGGGKEGGGRPGGKSGGGAGQRAGRPSAPREGASGLPAHAGTRGLVYPAPQPVVSNPPRPTNRIQTILQPDIPKAPELKVPVPMPNLVQMRRKTPAPPALIPKVKVELEPTPEAPQLQARLQPQRVPLSIRAAAPAPLPAEPKLSLPVAPVETSMPNLPPRPKTEVKPVIPQLNRAAAEPDPAAPELNLSSDPRGTDDRTLLALSPFPAPPEERPQVPEGEARGQFAMGPEPNLAGSGLGTPAQAGAPGASAQGDPSASSAAGAAGAGPGTGTGSGASGSGPGSGPGGTGAGGTGTGPGIAGSGDGLPAQAGSGGGSGPGSGGGTGGGIGAGRGSGEGSGVGSGAGGSGTGVGTGAGSGSGPGRGSGTGTGTGTGSGAGSGAGSGPFEGISIAGGTTAGRTGAPGGSRTPADPGPRPSYGMTVTSTASSGGGLRDYGIFRNESVFTVYIEMTHSPTRAPSWILQYAQMRGPSGSGASAGSIRLGGEVVAPYPITKETPEFPRDVVARNLGKLVVVYGEISGEGRVESTRVIQSPNPLLNRPALDALKKWEFRPAEADGTPVRVKVLVGIPLSLPPE